jgi:hypothetical protein
MSKRKDRKRKGNGGGGGGTLMGMRSGFQGLVGVRKGPAKKQSKTWNVISWVLVIGLAGAALFLFLRRYF